MSVGNLILDSEIRKSDVDAIRELVREAGVFNQEEIDVAAELVELKLDGYEDSYQFLFMRDQSGVPLAYTLHAIVPLTISRYDLYWIVVSPKLQNQGIGSKIYRECEKQIIASGGKAIYIDTSATERYRPAREFYVKNGFKLAASFKDFYKEGDDKLIYEKFL